MLLLVLIGAILYGNLPDTPFIGRLIKRNQSRTSSASDTATILTLCLNQSLQQELYKGLFQGYPLPNETIPVELRASAAVEPTGVSELSSTTTPKTEDIPSSESQSGLPVRQVALLSGESVRLAFTPKGGMVSGLPREDPLLVLTDQRLMAFVKQEGMKETVLMPVEEIKAVAVKAGARSKGTLLQGGMMVVGAVVFYVLIAYWLTGRIDGPTVPIIRMDLVAFIVFLAVLSGVGLIAQIYFGKPDGEAEFQGDGVKVTFPFRGESAEKDIFELVNAAFAARQTMVSKIGVRNSKTDLAGRNTD